MEDGDGELGLSLNSRVMWMDIWVEWATKAPSLFASNLGRRPRNNASRMHPSLTGYSNTNERKGEEC